MSTIKKVFLLLIFLTGGIKIFAHPHVFIHYEAKYIMEKGKLEGIEVVWNMDDLSSFTFMTSYDSNQNKKLDKTEFVDLKNTTFDNMTDKDFYLQLLVNDQLVKDLKVEDFKVKMSKEKILTYSFFIDCSQTLLPKEANEIKFYFTDSSFYISFTSAQDEVEYEIDDSLTVTGTEIKYLSEHYLTVK